MFLRDRLRFLAGRSSGSRLAIDLGSANIRVATVGATPRIRSFPTFVAFDEATDEVVAWGEAARRMIGWEPRGIRVDSPVQAGVIAQPRAVEFLLRQTIELSVGSRRLLRPTIVLATPASATSVQLHAAVAEAHAAGARKVMLVRESLATALGAGLPVMDPRASLILEIGAGKTEIAVLALGGIVVSRTAPVGSEDIDDAIIQLMRRAHQLAIGRFTALGIKHEHASAVETDDPKSFVVRGRDLRSGLPTSLELKALELVAPIQEVLAQITATLHEVLEQTPPELSADISESGMWLSGGGSLLAGLRRFLQEQTSLPVHLVEDPHHAVVLGCLRCAEEPALLDRLDR